MRDRPISFILTALSLLLGATLLAAGCSSTPPPRPADAGITRSARSAFDSGHVETAARLYARALRRARGRDDAAEIGTNAYNLALCLVSLGDYDKARAALEEAKAEFSRRGDIPPEIFILEAKTAYRQGRRSEAEELVQQGLQRSPSLSPDELSQFILLQGRLAVDRGDLTAARRRLKEARESLKDTTGPAPRAEEAGLTGIILRAEEKPGPAAEEFDRRGELLRQAGNYREMALALGQAGDSYVSAGQACRAGERFFRAARSLFAQGDALTSLKMIESSLAALNECPEVDLQPRISDLFEKIRETVSAAAASNKTD